MTSTTGDKSSREFSINPPSRQSKPVDITRSRGTNNCSQSGLVCNSDCFGSTFSVLPSMTVKEGQNKETEDGPFLVKKSTGSSDYISLIFNNETSNWSFWSLSFLRRESASSILIVSVGAFISSSTITPDPRLEAGMGRARPLRALA
jgi:hypothetical protein